MTPYQYCTRCGTELSSHLKQRYREDHEGGPVLCQSCIIEIFQGIPKAMQAFADALISAVNGAFATTEADNE